MQTPLLDGDLFEPSPATTTLVTPPHGDFSALAPQEENVCDDFFLQGNSRDGEGPSSRGAVQYQDILGAFSDDED